jgi:predicted nucleic acid-binding protein
MSTVCLDTQIIYWGLVGRAPSAQQQYLVEQAQAFFQQLDAEKHHVIVPTIVVGELLVPLPEEEHAFFLAQVSQVWMLADYNAQAARWFARIRRAALTKERLRALQRETNATRKELIADVMIIATALAHQTEILYSHDNKLRHLAADWIETRNFTPHP